MPAAAKEPEIAATCLGVDVPDSPFLNEKRIERINGARYEGQEIRGAMHVVREGDNVLELGAGIGIVGAVVGKNNKPKKVVSFEANPELIPHIKALYKMNALTRRNTVRNEILISAPDAPKSLPFHLHNSFLGSSLNDLGSKGRDTIDVPVADYTEVNETLKPDVILMDIEGGELDFLAHADLSGVRAMVVEFHPKAYQIEGMRKCKALIRDAGLEPLPDLSSRLVWVAQRADAGANADAGAGGAG